MHRLATTSSRSGDRAGAPRRLPRLSLPPVGALLPALLAACSAASAPPDPSDAPAQAWAADCEPSEKPSELKWIELARAKQGTSPSALKVAETDKHLIVRVETPTLSPPYQIHIDTDGDWKTGIQFGSWEATGVDYVIESGALYKTKHPFADLSTRLEVQPQKRDGGFEFELPKERLEGLHADLDIGIGFVQAGKTQLPETRDFGRLKPDWKRGGVIVPAYLTPYQDDAWKTLLSAASLAPSDSGKKSDFWVVINGNDNGPYTTYSEHCGECKDKTPKELEDAKVVPDKYLEDAQRRWSAVANTEAKLIAYVHTCKEKKDCGGLRPLAAVQAAVDKWLKQVPELDGIWIDEFYPQHDVGSVQEGGQFVPELGHYGQLVDYIRSKRTKLGKKLVIVGNAGGRLVSDRMEYARLVDVLCSFEAAHDKLEAAPAIGETAAWPGIARQPVRPLYGQLALVHNVSALDQGEVVKRALAEGYTHVFVTDGNYERETLWLDIPAYLSTQRTQVMTAK